jgi:mercuric ion binding protein
MNKILISLAFAAASSIAFATQTVKATVNGMVCSFCAQGIEKRIGKMDATKAVLVDLKNKTVAVEPKPGKTLDQKAITAEITDAGYDVVKLETVSQSVADIKAQLKGGK